MSLSLIIDGYNLIRQSPEMREHDREDLDRGRMVLLQKLSAYKRLKRHRITVVFDGWLHGYFSEGCEKMGGISVRFSRRGEKADEVIKRLAAKYKDKAVVVTTDRDLGVACSREGCEVITSQEFEERIALAACLDQKDVGEEEVGFVDRDSKSTKKKGPSRRLPKADRRRIRALRKL